MQQNKTSCLNAIISAGNELRPQAHRFNKGQGNELRRRHIISINHNGIVRDLRQKKVLVGFWLAKLE